MKKIKIFGIIFVIILIISYIFLFFRQNRNEPRTIKIGILNTPNDVAVARKANLFKKELPGYKFQFITFDSGVDANKALMTNSIDFATMGDTNAIVALTNDIPAKLFFINELCNTNEALVVKKSNHIFTPLDLKGKKIATPFASTSHISLLYFLHQHGLENKVTPYDMDTQNIVAAWKRNQIDAAYSWEPTLSELKKTGFVLTDSKKIATKGMLTGNVTLVSNQFAQKHPKERRKIRDILLKVHQMRKQHPQQTIELAAKQVGISFKNAKLQVNGTTWPNKNEENTYLQENGKFLKAMYTAGKYMKRNQNLNFAPTIKQLEIFIWNDQK